MLTGGRLLRLGAHAARAQAWAFVPLFVGAVLARLLGLMPTLTLAARFVRIGGISSGVDPATAWVLGLLADLDDPAPWATWAAGSMVALVGAWLLQVVLQAGALRVLAAQAGTSEVASDEAFSEGLLGAPARYLVTAALAEVLKFMMIGCVLGALVAALVYFGEHPGALAALMMTVATCSLLLMPFVVAALELGFARSVILEEPPSVALGEGLVLFARRVVDYVPPWYLLKVVGLMLAMTGGFFSAVVGALPGDQDLWILRLGPAAMAALFAVALETGVAFVQLGVNAALVADESGTVPEPPAVVEPVLQAVALGPGEPILVARELPSEPPPSNTGNDPETPS